MSSRRWRWEHTLCLSAGLALGGERGAAYAIKLLQREIDLNLTLLGCPGTAGLTRDYLRHASQAWLGPDPLRATTASGTQYCMNKNFNPNQITDPTGDLKPS
jgi:hypothetical protein